jgi:hypothetical protein
MQIVVSNRPMNQQVNHKYSYQRYISIIAETVWFLASIVTAVPKTIKPNDVACSLSWML